MKLKENITIEKETHGVSIVKTEVRNNEKGVPTEYKTKKYFGTVYQALQKYMHDFVKNAETISDVEVEVMKAMNVIKAAEDEIKDTFCIVVRKEKP